MIKVCAECGIEFDGARAVEATCGMTCWLRARDRRLVYEQSRWSDGDGYGLSEMSTTVRLSRKDEKGRKQSGSFSRIEQGTDPFITHQKLYAYKGWKHDQTVCEGSAQDT